LGIQVEYDIVICYSIQTKAAELAGILEGKTVFYVKIETPNGQESINEITLERRQGIACRVEGIILTLAQNGGLQIKTRL
jgi:hypothetical protein